MDESALLAALNAGRLAGAALDVMSDEQALLAGNEHAITKAARERRNLIVTPHIGGASNDSMRATEMFIARKLRAVLTAQDQERPAQ